MAGSRIMTSLRKYHLLPSPAVHGQHYYDQSSTNTQRPADPKDSTPVQVECVSTSVYKARSPYRPYPAFGKTLSACGSAI